MLPHTFTDMSSRWQGAAGRASANAEDSLIVYIQYKPAPFFKLLVPLVCHEVETSQVDRLEVR